MTIATDERDRESSKAGHYRGLRYRSVQHLGSLGQMLNQFGESAEGYSGTQGDQQGNGNGNGDGKGSDKVKTHNR